MDANGNELVNGDTVIVTKDLPVKGVPKPIKAGTKVKNIHFKEGDHNISCKIDGFGTLALKSIYVRKGVNPNLRVFFTFFTCYKTKNPPLGRVFYKINLHFLKEVHDFFI